MVKYCAVAVCKNGSHNRPDLSYFRFPSDQKLRKKWETFCRRADEKFKTLADPRICSQHFSREDLKKGRFPERLKSFLVVYRQYLIRNSPQQRVILVKRGKTSGIVEHNTWQIIQQSYR